MKSLKYLLSLLLLHDDVEPRVTLMFVLIFSIFLLNSANNYSKDYKMLENMCKKRCTVVTEPHNYREWKL